MSKGMYFLHTMRNPCWVLQLQTLNSWGFLMRWNVRKKCIKKKNPSLKCYYLTVVDLWIIEILKELLILTHRIIHLTCKRWIPTDFHVLPWVLTWNRMRFPGTHKLTVQRFSSAHRSFPTLRNSSASRADRVSQRSNSPVAQEPN